MRIGIVDASGKEKIADIFEEYIHDKVEQVVCKKKKALDLFDALALLKQFEGLDHRLLIVPLIRDDDEKEEAFFEALANLEANSGKIVFKCIYYEDEEPKDKIIEVADEMIEYLFGEKKEEPVNEEESDNEEAFENEPTEPADEE